MRSYIRRVFSIGVVLAVLAGCSAPHNAAGSSSDAGSAGSSQKQAVHVFAAASLKTTFDRIEADFEASHPQIDLVFNYAGSQDLVAQMQSGAPADVFASASNKWMDTATESGLIDGEAVVFASNTLEMAVAKGNPKNIAGIDDVAARPELVAVRCAAAVPCGDLTDTVLSKTGKSVEFDTEQNSVTQTLGLVSAGEADVAFVYETDVASDPEHVEGVSIAGAEDYSNQYPIAVTSEASTREVKESAQEFMDYVLSPEGQKALQDSGFGPGSE